MKGGIFATKEDAFDDEGTKSMKPVTFRCLPQRPNTDAGCSALFVVDRGGDEPSDCASTTPISAGSKKETVVKGRKLAASRGDDNRVNEALSRSVIHAGYEKNYDGGFKKESVRAEKKKRAAERKKTKGDDWFGMPATEINDERRHDLELLQMRNALDTKTHYKANNDWTKKNQLPRYFQFGRVVDGVGDRYSRIPKRQRQRTMVDELLADSEFRTRSKKRALELREKALKTRRGTFRHGQYPNKSKKKQRP